MKLNTNHKNKLFFFLIITISFLFFSGFMFLQKENYPIWAGDFPYVRFKANLTSFQDNVQSVEDSIINSSDSWFRESKAKFRLSYEGTSSKTMPEIPSAIECSATNQKDLWTKEKTVFASHADDPDCTGDICSFLWSCEKTILHFDIQVNAKDYKWNTLNSLEAGELDLATILIHEFGHVAGLSHCLAGDTLEQCQTKLASFMRNPTSSETMYKFKDVGIVKRTLANEDIAGIKYLYGEIKTSLPLYGKYALNNDDVLALSIDTKLAENDRTNTPLARQMQARSIKEMYEFINSQEVNKSLDWAPITGYLPGMSFEQYTDFAFQSMQQSLSAKTNEELLIMRQSSTIGVATMDDLLEKVIFGADVPDKSILAMIQTKNNALRNAVIDEQVRRR